MGSLVLCLCLCLWGAVAWQVDLENHSFRSYEGFLCLMQLSTRDHDFVIDTLVPPVRQHLPRLLGPIFESSTIVKVRKGPILQTGETVNLR